MSDLELQYLCDNFTNETLSFATFVGIGIGVVVTSLFWALALLWLKGD